MKELLPRSSARVGLTRFCFLLLCGSGQRPSWLFESVTSHFAFIRSSFTLSVWLNTFACSVSHMTSLALMSSCQGTHLALVRLRGTRSFRGGLSTCLSQRVLLAGYGYSVLLSRGLFQVFFRIFRTFSVLHSVGRSTLCKLLHCALAHSVRVCAGACARVGRLTAGFLGRSGRVLGLGWYRTRGEGVNALTGACRGLCVGLGVWDA